tara:strand:- start:15331 stop:15507 length:177 start_codon:yes stop_codon:yes gene_type:complete
LVSVPEGLDGKGPLTDGLNPSTKTLLDLLSRQANYGFKHQTGMPVLNTCGLGQLLPDR